MLATTDAGSHGRWRHAGAGEGVVVSRTAILNNVEFILNGDKNNHDRRDRARGCSEDS